ncbi:MAG: hypothetical protein ACPG8W_02720 [Candidatus Promineifilaceae bacterium]
MNSQEIPIANLKLQVSESTPYHSESILENEIEGIHVTHVAITGEEPAIEYSVEGCKTIYLFISGTGVVNAANTAYAIVPETILLPNIVEKVSIRAAKNDTLHYLKISSELTAQDIEDLKEFPATHMQHVYYAKFTDCQSYSETIKSANTISRTILPNRYIPRIAMGTVETKGPDLVAAHEHAMLEQLFLGLANNNCVVYADEAQVDFPQYSVLHIPLGSNHSVSVESDQVMYYVWMDFFLDKEGEEWLKNHKVNDNN